MDFAKQSQPSKSNLLIGKENKVRSLCTIAFPVPSILPGNSNETARENQCIQGDHRSQNYEPELFYHMEKEDLPSAVGNLFLMETG